MWPTRWDEKMRTRRKRRTHTGVRASDTSTVATNISGHGQLPFGFWFPSCLPRGVRYVLCTRSRSTDEPNPPEKPTSRFPEAFRPFRRCSCGVGLTWGSRARRKRREMSGKKHSLWLIVRTWDERDRFSALAINCISNDNISCLEFAFDACFGPIVFRAP